MGYRCIRRVFDDGQETRMVIYYRTTNIFTDYHPKKFSWNMPDTRNKNKVIGEDRFSAFIKRNTGMLNRLAQSTGLSRATSCNLTNVILFFTSWRRWWTKKNYKSTLLMKQRCHNSATCWSCYPKGTQAGYLTNFSGQRDSSNVLAINYTGNSVPRIIILPGLTCHAYFVRVGPVRCIIAGNESARKIIFITPQSF